MPTQDLRDQLVEMSRTLGSNVAFAQGGGGNTSAKLPDGTMLIKASGVELRNVTRDQGFAQVPLKEFLKLLEEPQLTDNRLTAQSAALSMNGARPSIETGLHAVVPAPLVAHTHNVYLNVLTCALNGKDLVEQHFGTTALWVPFVNPGLELVRTVAMLIRGREEVKYLFLQNHGFVTWGKSWEEISRFHSEATELARNTFGLPVFELGLAQAVTDFPGVLFPDQVVFGSSQAGGRVYVETVSACSYLFRQLDRLGLQPTFIPDQKTQEISGMDSEKFRQSVSGQSC